MNLRKRGQFFSADFIIAVLILTAALGTALHLHEFAARTSSRTLELAANDAEMIAEALANNAAIAVPASLAYCFQYSNGTGNCSAFACGGNAYAARRLVECTGSVKEFCALEVRACG